MSRRKRTSPNELMLRDQFGNLHAVIPNLVNRFGQRGAADKLSVPQSFISRWLNRNGYEQRWIKSQEQQAS